MEQDELLWIEDGDILFEEGVNDGTCSYYGWQDNLDLAFHGYIDGYKNSADILLDEALRAGEKGRVDILDTFIYPISFLYRQFMELCLKSIYLNYSGKTDEEKKNYINEVGHNLKKSWTHVRPIIIEYSFTQEENFSINVAEQYVEQMHDFDSNSFQFRYPIDKKVYLIHKTEKYINLTNLKEKMEKFYNYYRGIDGLMSAHIHS